MRKSRFTEEFIIAILRHQFGDVLQLWTAKLGVVSETGPRHDAILKDVNSRK